MTSIEFQERYFEGGTMQVRLVANLPIGRDGKRYSYSIRVDSNGRCECKSRADGDGSTRYHAFLTLDEAIAHATKWAKRKMAGK